MDYIIIFFLWILVATVLAGITYMIVIFSVKKDSKRKITLLWLVWICSPIDFIVLMVLSCFVSVVKDSYENKINVIKKAWNIFAKKLLGE